jgi:hypothetical protein
MRKGAPSRNLTPTLEGRGTIAQCGANVEVDSQNPHLPAAAPAGLLSREVTGEVSEAAAAGHHDTKKEPGFFASL